MKTLVILATLVFGSFFISVPASYAEGVGKQQAAGVAQGQHPGRVIDIKLLKFQGQLAYRVKILDQAGGVHVVIVNKATGEVVSSH